jgi:ubiquinone/menaquinone biosynthesis C-methylase UbiE
MILGRYLSFEGVADDYDQTRVIPAPQLEEIARILSRETPWQQAELFLDAGIGTGRFAAPLACLHPGQVIGVDIAPAMMERVGEKVDLGTLALAQADLQRLPFPESVFAGALVVHILPLIERWTLVLEEIRRVLIPAVGALFLGIEMGGRSVLVDFYYQRARAKKVLASSLGSASMAVTLAYLRRAEHDGGAGAQVTLLETPTLSWERRVPVTQTLEALAHRTYSQMWGISDEAHRDLMTETRHYAGQTFAKREAVEMLRAHFQLYKAVWPDRQL